MIQTHKIISNRPNVKKIQEVIFHPKEKNVCSQEPMETNKKL